MLIYSHTVQAHVFTKHTLHVWKSHILSYYPSCVAFAALQLSAGRRVRRGDPGLRIDSACVNVSESKGDVQQTGV